jgi:hypothetical protein
MPVSMPGAAALSRERRAKPLDFRAGVFEHGGRRPGNSKIRAKSEGRALHHRHALDHLGMAAHKNSFFYKFLRSLGAAFADPMTDAWPHHLSTAKSGSMTLASRVDCHSIPSPGGARRS